MQGSAWGYLHTKKCLGKVTGIRSLLVKRRNDNHSPGPVIRELEHVPAGARISPAGAITKFIKAVIYIRIFSIIIYLPGAVARSEASSLGMQAAPSSIPTSGTFFRGDLVMKTFQRPFSLFR